MEIKHFLGNQDWDSPFFKRLANNDTGDSRGHQGGMVLPKDLRPYLPSLDTKLISVTTPTSDRYLQAEMYLGTNHFTDSTIRYQIQTWGGTRSPESRLTEGFAPLRNHAHAGDILIFQRRSDTLDTFRLILLSQSSEYFTEVNQLTERRNWGSLYLANLPVSQTQIVQAKIEIDTLEQNSFQLQRSQIPRVETRQERIARSVVFSKAVKEEYQYQCAVSGITLATPTMRYEVQSAHVVPVSERGLDDVRNGIALTQTLHWAFDRGLFGILPDRTIYIPKKVKTMTENSFLKQFEAKPIREARTKQFQVHPSAFQWHFEKYVSSWE